MPSQTPRAELHSRPPLARMMQVHALLKSGKYPNCRNLAQELEVSAKTMQRDIDFMRYQLGLPIEYDALKFGFYYSEPVTSFPNIDITEGEIVALYVGQKALAQYKGTPFERPLATAFRKISAGLRDSMSFSFGDLGSAVSFRTFGRTVADLETFELISHAVLKSVELHFDYKKLAGRSYEARVVQPYHLASIEGLWYLFAFDTVREQLRTFALPRIRKVHVTKTRFRRPADFSVTRYLQESFGVFSAGKGRAQLVRLRFDAFSAQLVQEREWHPSQRVKRHADGSIEFTVTLGGLEEVERWVLSWGSHVEVVAPKALRERVAREAAAVARLND